MINSFLFNEVVNDLKEKHINDLEYIKSRFMLQITLFLDKYYPAYQKDSSSVDNIFKTIANSISKLDGKLEDEVYNQLSIELDEYLPNWQLYKDVNTFIIKLSEAMVNKYISLPKLNFNDAVYYTLKKNYENGVNLDNEDNLKKAMYKLLNKYFYENRVLVFTRENGARAYMLSKTKEEVLEEIFSYLNIGDLNIKGLDELINLYVDKMMKKFISQSEANSRR